MSNKGFSHIGLSTLDLDKTRAFYEDVLGFKPVVSDTLRIQEGGHLRHVFFDVGRDQLLAFMEANDMPGVPAQYDAGIVFYHFAFEAGSESGLAAKRDQLRAKGLDVTDIVDHGWAKSIYFSDPNGLSLEYCCLVRDLTEDDAVMQERGTIPLARLGFKKTTGAELSRVPSARGKVTA
jgi:catechol 2,3-dioxygenase-like lactoylglutathione lyase family enzyme